MTEVYAVIIQDHHTDVDVEVWADQDAAITRGKALAKEYCRHTEDYEETAIPGWLVHATYSCESDSVRVEKVVVQE